jgi:Zn-dependent protease
MSLAGPGANFTLMIIAAVCIRIGMAGGILQAPASAGFTNITELTNPETATSLLRFLASFLGILFSQNLLLGTFNLLPVPPLDGGTGVTLLMSERLALRFLSFAHDPSFQMIGLIASWYLFGEVFYPIFVFALNVLYPGLYT